MICYINVSLKTLYTITGVTLLLSGLLITARYNLPANPLNYINLEL